MFSFIKQGERREGQIEAKASPQLLLWRLHQEGSSLGFYDRMIWAQIPDLPVTDVVAESFAQAAVHLTIRWV